MGRCGGGAGPGCCGVQELALPQITLGLEELKLGEGQMLGETPLKFFWDFQPSFSAHLASE